MTRLGYLVEGPIVVYCDNQSEIYVANNLIAHSKMKHVEIHAHYFKWMVQDNIVNLTYCRI
jgi:hypothetical protein